MSFQFLPIQLNACVYVLELENDCIYVGATMNFNVRMAQHFAGMGAKWTKLHKPLKVLEVLYPLTPGLENKITQKYFELKGKEKVRGGSWCRVDKQKSTANDNEKGTTKEKEKEKENPYTIVFDSTPIYVHPSLSKTSDGFLSGLDFDSSDSADSS
jgi:hypothetical protein